MVSTGKKLMALAVLLAAVATPMIATATEHVVNITFISFEPNDITILAGDTVRWTNNSVFVHTSTSGVGCAANGLWSLVMNPADQVTHVFNAPGSYPYFCIPHCGSGMTGTIHVDTPVPTEQTTWGAIKALFKPNPAE